jgi:hypothetical protein
MMENSMTLNQTCSNMKSAANAGIQQYSMTCHSYRGRIRQFKPIYLYGYNGYNESIAFENARSHVAE